MHHQASFAFQMILGTMIAIEQVDASSGTALFDVPFQVPTYVSVGQFLSIILCLATQNDILVSIRSFISLGDTSNWDVAIGEDGNRSSSLWFVRIALPNTMKLCQGVLVTLVSFVIIVQASHIIDLLKDFTALMVISEVDNIMFQLAKHGYLGDELSAQVEKVEDNNVASSMSYNSSSQSIRQRKTGLLLVRLVFLTLLFGMIGWWADILSKQIDGTFFEQKFPGCNVTGTFLDAKSTKAFDLAKQHFGDDECYGGPLNTLECKFENGDCVNFNLAYPLCKGDNLTDVEKQLGNGNCSDDFATYECGYDGGDCCSHEITRDPKFGDGECNGGIMGTKRCGYDEGDCNAFVRDFPDCPLTNGSDEIILGNKICEGSIFTIEKCGWEYGDCSKGQIGQDVVFRGISSGSSVHFKTIMSGDGSKLMIGMYKTDHVSNSFNATTAPGKVRIVDFDQPLKNWTSYGDDLIGNKTGGMSGFGSAMSDDGKYALVGGPMDNVRVYSFSSLENKWVQFGQNLVEAGSVLMSYQVDMAHDGSRLVISFPFESNLESKIQAGMIRAFEMTSHEQRWVQIGKDIYGMASKELLGYIYVQLDSMGSRIFCSIGDRKREERALRVFEYQISVDEWTQSVNDLMTPSNNRHQRPAISADGNRFAISISSDPKKDDFMVIVYDLIIDYNVTEWKPLGTPIKAKKIGDRDVFGYRLSMSSDGTLLAIAKLDLDCLGPEWCSTGLVQLYRYDARNPPHRPFSLVPEKRVANSRNIMRESERKIDHHIFGFSMSLSKDGSKIHVSGYDFHHGYGFVKVYEVNQLFYTNCSVSDSTVIGDGYCRDYEPYYTIECGWDGGDCSEPLSVDEYPACRVYNPKKIGNGVCNDIFPYNTKECEYDGGDCEQPKKVEAYLDCYVTDPTNLGNDKCANGPPYDSFECGFDGGDCLPDGFKPSNTSDQSN